MRLSAQANNMITFFNDTLHLHELSYIWDLIEILFLFSLNFFNSLNQNVSYYIHVRSHLSQTPNNISHKEVQEDDMLHCNFIKSSYTSNNMNLIYFLFD